MFIGRHRVTERNDNCNFWEDVFVAGFFHDLNRSEEGKV